MMSNVFKNSDPINKLPTDDEELSTKEQSIIDMLYPEPPPLVQKLPEDTKKAWFHFKDIIIATILFFILNLPISDKLFEKFVKTENTYYKLLAKSLTFSVLFFFINNYSLSRQK